MIAVRAGAEIVALVASALATIWVSRAVGPGLFGFYAVASVVFQLGALLSNLGLSSRGAQVVANNPTRAPRAWTTVVAGRTVASATLIAIVEVTLTVAPLPGTLDALLRVAAPAWLVGSFRGEWLLVALGRVGAAAGLRVATTSASALLAVTLVHSERDAANLGWLIAGPVFVAASLALLETIRTGIIRPSTVATSWAEVKDYFAGGLHYLRGDISALIFTSSDRLFLYAFATPVAVGLYDAAYRLLQPFYAVAAVVNDAFFARIAAAFGTDRLNAIFRRYVDLSLALTIPLGFLCVANADPIIKLIYGPRFADAAGMLSILGWVITFGFTSGVLVFPFTAWNRAREYGDSVTAGGLTNLVLNVALIPPLAGMGAAIATVAAKIAVTVVGFRYFRTATGYAILGDFAAYAAVSGAALTTSLAARSIGGAAAGIPAFLLTYGITLVGVRGRAHFRTLRPNQHTT